jgi:hypothetical protein
VVHGFDCVVALALPESTGLPDQSGVLVSSGERLHAKAITLSPRKWVKHGVIRVRGPHGLVQPELAVVGNGDRLGFGAVGMAASTGPKISSCAIRSESSTSANTVGWTTRAAGPTGPHPHQSREPCRWRRIQEPFALLGPEQGACLGRRLEWIPEHEAVGKIGDGLDDFCIS